MKTLKILTISTLMLISFKLSAQFKVLSSGNAYIPSNKSYWIGSTSDNGVRLRMHATSSHAYIDFYNNLYFRSGSSYSAIRMTLTPSGRLTMGDYPSPRWDYSISSYVMESNYYYAHSNINNERMYLGESANYVYVRGRLGAGDYVSANFKLYVSGDAYADGRWQGSDLRMKKDVKELDMEYCNNLSKLNGISYKLKPFREERTTTDKEAVDLIASSN